eukprot:10746-Heterococcus_DN1.PRE.1
MARCFPLLSTGHVPPLGELLAVTAAKSPSNHAQQPKFLSTVFHYCSAAAPLSANELPPKSMDIYTQGDSPLGLCARSPACNDSSDGILITASQEDCYNPFRFRACSHATLLPCTHCTDVQYDYYGKRLATCSSDQTVRVWDLDEKLASSLLKMTIAAVRSLTTVHRICIQCGREEQEGLRGDAAAQSRVTWYPKAQLSDSRKQVQDIAFSPSHLGLKLASGSADGSVRIYEAIDVMNLNHWPLQEVFEVGGTGSGVTCLSWCTSRFDQPMLAVGTDTGKVQLWRYEEAVRAWQLTCELQSHALSVTDIDWAPNVGRSYHLIASCGKDRCLKVHKLPRAGGGIAAQQHYDAIPVQTASAVWRVQWNITGTILAASGEESDSVQLYKADFNGQWKCLAQLASDIAGDSMLEQNQ